MGAMEDHPDPELEDEQHPTVTFTPVDPNQPPAVDEALLGDVEGFALVVNRGPRAGMTWLVQTGTTTIGRGPEQDIFLDDVTVSRRHAELLVGESGVPQIKDAGSTNGIYVNGERLDEAELAPTAASRRSNRDLRPRAFYR